MRHAGEEGRDLSLILSISLITGFRFPMRFGKNVLVSRPGFVSSLRRSPIALVSKVIALEATKFSVLIGLRRVRVEMNLSGLCYGRDL
jgi:hypothetical protein